MQKRSCEHCSGSGMHSEISVTNGAAHSVDETALIAIQIADNSESVLRLRAAASPEGLTASRQVDPLQRPVTLGFQAVLGEPSVRASCPERATPRAHNLDGRGILPIRRPRMTWRNKVGHIIPSSLLEAPWPSQVGCFARERTV